MTKSFFKKNLVIEFFEEHTGNVYVFGEETPSWVTPETPCLFVSKDIHWAKENKPRASFPIKDEFGSVNWVSGFYCMASAEDLAGTTAERVIKNWESENK